MVDFKRLAKKFETKADKGLDKVSKAVMDINLEKKIKSKAILKKSKATLVLKEKKAAEYVPIYFQAELNETKKNLFLE